MNDFFYILTAMEAELLRGLIEEIACDWTCKYEKEQALDILSNTIEVDTDLILEAFKKQQEREDG